MKIASDDIGLPEYSNYIFPLQTIDVEACYLLKMCTDNSVIMVLIQLKISLDECRRACRLLNVVNLLSNV